MFLTEEELYAAALEIQEIKNKALTVFEEDWEEYGRWSEGLPESRYETGYDCIPW